jgi:hypothetical protein
MKRHKPLTMRMWAHMNRSRTGRLRFVMCGGDPFLARQKKDVTGWIEDDEVKGDEAVRVTVKVEER